jgi:hypothetical protein
MKYEEKYVNVLKLETALLTGMAFRKKFLWEINCILESL